MNIAIIPARTTSKRLPNKNFKMFFGRPIIGWVLDEIKKSELFDKIIVSTDTDQWKLNGSRLHIRKDSPYEQTVDEVCLEVLEEYPGHEYMCCVYPTAYAVTWLDLCRSFEMMIREKNDMCVSVGMLNRKNDEPADIDNGGIYWERCSHGALKGLSKHIMEQVDINTIEDFAQAKIHAYETFGNRFQR